MVFNSGNVEQAFPDGKYRPAELVGFVTIRPATGVTLELSQGTVRSSATIQRPVAVQLLTRVIEILLLLRTKWHKVTLAL